MALVKAVENSELRLQRTSVGWWRVFLYVAYYLRLRRGEILGLTWDKVNLDTLEVVVSANTSKGRKDRIVPLAAELGEMLRVWHARKNRSPRLLRRSCRGRTSGADRSMLYIVAASTGFRKEELARLTDANFKLEGEKPTVTVKGAYTKNGKPATLPLQKSLAIALKEWMPKGKLWPGTWCERAAKMLRKDLEAARTAWIEGAIDPKERERREKSDALAHKDKQGMVFDFHALRGQFITNLVLAGVHPKIAKKLARHSTITLTMDRYAKVKMDDMETAVEALPAMPNLDPKSWTKNWTTDVDISGQSTSSASNFTPVENDTGAIENPLEHNGLDIESHFVTLPAKSAPCRTRTYNPLIKSQLLCQLS